MKYKTGDRVYIKTMVKLEKEGIHISDIDREKIEEITGKNLLIKGMAIANNCYIADHPRKKEVTVQFPMEYIEKLVVPKKRTQKQKIEKPPLGLTPYKIYEELDNKSRIQYILNAMMRYSEKKVFIPVEWTVELVDRVLKP